MELIDGTARMSAGIDMKKGFNRLDTFVNWPVPYLAPRVMAAAGLIYSGTEDTVDCAFCHIIRGRKGYEQDSG